MSAHSLTHTRTHTHTHTYTTITLSLSLSHTHTTITFYYIPPHSTDLGPTKAIIFRQPEGGASVAVAATERSLRASAELSGKSVVAATGIPFLKCRAAGRGACGGDAEDVVGRRVSGGVGGAVRAGDGGDGGDGGAADCGASASAGCSVCV